MLWAGHQVDLVPQKQVMTLADEDALDITWEAEDESFLGTAELWDGYPEGVAPTTDAFPQDPGELEGEGTREERQHIPTGLPAREEDEG